MNLSLPRDANGAETGLEGESTVLGGGEVGDGRSAEELNPNGRVESGETSVLM